MWIYCRVPETLFRKDTVSLSFTQCELLQTTKIQTTCAHHSESQKPKDMSFPGKQFYQEGIVKLMKPEPV